MRFLSALSVVIGLALLAPAPASAQLDPMLAQRTKGKADAPITVYERRTGKVVSTKAFTAAMCSLDYDEKAIDDHVHSFVK